MRFTLHSNSQPYFVGTLSPKTIVSGRFYEREVFPIEQPIPYYRRRFSEEIHTYELENFQEYRIWAFDAVCLKIKIGQDTILSITHDEKSHGRLKNMLIFTEELL